MENVIYQIQKNNNEIIRIDVSEYKGRELINIRIWYHTQDPGTGEVIYKPTQKGITLDIGKFEELKSGILKLENYLQDRAAGHTPSQPEIKDEPAKSDKKE